MQLDRTDDLSAFLCYALTLETDQKGILARACDILAPNHTCLGIGRKRILNNSIDSTSDPYDRRNDG